MEKYLQNKIDEILFAKRVRKRKRLALIIVSVVLAVTVSYLTIVPAVTLTGDPDCGMEEHTHTDACYTETRVLTCGQQEHVHTDACYEDVLVCGKEETPGHTHTDACYQEVKTLICGLEEGPDHTHTDACYKTERVLICGQEESEPHVHTAECYEKRLVCGLQEHTHTRDCYTTERVLTCGKEEHTHTRDCYHDKPVVNDLVRTYSDGNVAVTATLSAESMIPAAAQLSASPVTSATVGPDKYYEMLQKAGDAVLDKNQVISDIVFYDIGFNLDGEAIEPAAGEVKVSISFSDPLFAVADVERASELKVLHFEESGDVVDVTDVIENADEGVTAVEFSTGGFSSFCIVLADTYITGNFYQRVTTIDSTSARYMIASAQGNYALSSTETGYSRAMTINPVKGNPTYYTATVGATNAADITDINWVFNTLIPGASGTSTVQVDATHRLRLGNATFISTTAENQTLAYTALTKCWTIVQSGYYLYMTPGTGSGVFSRNNGTTNTENRNVLIYKLVNTTLTIPGDVIYDDGTGHGGGETKPTYPPYITPSGAKSAAFTVAGKSIAAVSDAATSQIESKYAGVKADDGKVVTDKSVIYGDDDYGAFANYADGEFGVAMSAMGQEFNIAVEQSYVAPIDVVLIIDTSGSMVNNSVPSGGTRALAAVNALNDTIDFIMTANPGNRVGVVNFSSGSWDFMQLGRYYVGTAGAVINYSPGYDYATITNSGAPGSTLATNTALRFADTRALATSVSFNSWGGTHTQLGMAQAAAMMLRNTDTTFTAPTGEIVNRTPVIIMLSDGDPTHCTSNYMDALNGPHYGSGVASGTTNNKGILGYNTILSGNYYKMQIGIHYKEVAKWFSVGLGIYATGYDDMSGSSATGDHVKRAVLYPTAQSIADLYNFTLAQNYTITALQLYQLLNGTYAENTVTVGTNTAATLPFLGVTNRYVPVLKNQYTNYKYADNGFFGDFTTAELNAVLQAAINQSREVYNYGFILKNSTNVDMSDPIGVGMELKAPPVLRFNGTNYSYTSVDTVTNAGTTTTTYHYNYTATDPYTTKEFTLDDVIVEVITDISGNQTVHFFVYEHDLPVYQPDQAQSFYYEELPARLIYKVGLTDSALAGAKKNDVFYTNRWDGSNTTTATFLPADDNPYYILGTYQNVTENKSVNYTSTIATKFRTDLTGDTATHFLGNNGRLTITDAPEFVTVTVNKAWQQYDGSPISDPAVLAGLPDITVRLYQGTSPGGSGGTLYDTVTFGNAEGWSYTWTGLPEEDGGGHTYYYYIQENGVDGYITSYTNNGGIASGIITVTNTAGGMILPATGGIGITPYTTAGVAVMILVFLMMFADYLLYIEKRKRGKVMIRPPDG